PGLPAAGGPVMNRVGISREWRAGMETRCEDRAGQQVQCLTSEPGSMWIHGLDDPPDAVRARLARSRYNLCPVCVAAEADAAGSGRPSVAIYFADKMQQRLMLGCGPFWRRDRCHRLHAFALARHHQTQAIIAKRLGPVRMPDHPREPLYIGRNPRFTIV